MSAGHARPTPAVAPRPPIPEGPYLIAGLGRAGRAAIAALAGAVGPELVRAWDADTSAGMQRLRARLEAQGIRVALGSPPTRREVGWARTVIKSPGIPFTESVIQRARGKRREVIDELELGWRLSRAPVIAVTGTNGKSTVCGLTAAALSAAGLRTSVAGNTEFGPPLSAISAEPLDRIVCEVSSYQLEGCVEMLPELAVFTNLTPEHLGRHGTLERYGEVKRRLFIHRGEVVAQAVVDVDTAPGRALADDVELRGAVVTRVGLVEDADYRVQSADWDLRRARTQLRTPAGPVALATALPGEYNARNVAAALAIADLSGVPRDVSIAALSAFSGLPGRFEHIDAGQPFEVIVDFAHTPDGLEHLLATLRAGMAADAQLRVVLGVGGATGTGMEEMGRLTGRLCDRLTLTTSGFRCKPPLLALGGLLTGARASADGRLEVILDRRRAIHSALRSAGVGDVVVIPGRGALGEMRSDPRGEALPFDDREVAREALGALGFGAPAVGDAQALRRAVVPQSLTSSPRRFSRARISSSAV